jgi:pyruvate dehydrogenase E1 component beta subunit
MREIMLKDAIREALDEEMERNPEVILLGEDIREYGLGNVTEGLYKKYPGRVLDTPLSETAIAGLGLGAAYAGMVAVPEIMYTDFLSVVYDYIYNQASKNRYMTGFQEKGSACCWVMRAVSGAGLRCAGQHSQCGEGMFMNIPGIKIAVPSTPYDAKGLLKYAMRGNDPVVFLEHRMQYFSKGPVPEPGEDYVVPFASSDIKREGSDVTVVAVQWMVEKSLKAAAKLEEEGVSVEVVDPRSLKPLDMDTILKSVRKTGRLVLANEGYTTGNALNEVAVRIFEDGAGILKAPLVRVCGPDTPIPFTPVLEDAWIPSEDDIIEGIRKTL